MARPRLFTEAQVREWRRLHQKRKQLPTVRAMAKKAGISHGHMDQILRGEIYKTVR